jgi:hypothetical protein
LLTASPSEGEAPILAARFRPPYGLLSLLAARKYAYVVKSKDSRGRPMVLQRNRHYAVSDNPECELNRHGNFEIVNGLLGSHNFLISIADARRTLQSLEKESTDSSYKDHLLEGL